MQQTYYDTLKVSRDAPIEVIRAAYRVLSLKYHPDRHSGDGAAAETMGLLNKAYEVLSDPERRYTYDASIRQIEAELLQVRAPRARAARPTRTDAEHDIGSDAAPTDRIALHMRRWGLLYGSAVLVLVTVAVVVSFKYEPQKNSWVAATPSPEDREAYIRQRAREVMLRPGNGEHGSPAIPTPLDASALPPGDSPASATMPAMPVEQAEAPSAAGAPRPNEPARPGAPPSEAVHSAPDLLPSISPPDEEAVDRARSAFESQSGSTEPVAGTE